MRDKILPFIPLSDAYIHTLLLSVYLANFLVENCPCTVVVQGNLC